MRSFISLSACLIAGWMLSGRLDAAGTPDIDQICKTAGYQRVELVERNGVFVCECKFKDTRITMMLDTGMPYCSIDKAIVEKHGVKMLDDIELSVLGGSLTGKFVDVGSIAIGSFDTLNISNALMAVAVEGIKNKFGYDGRISLEAMQMMGAIIDYHNRVMYLRRPVTAAWPKLSGRWTASSWKEDGVSRPIDTTSPPAFDFADDVLTITDGKSTRRLAFDYALEPERDFIWLCDPKNMGKISRKYEAAGVVKVSGETMTVCLRFGKYDPATMPTEFKSEKGSGHTLIELKQPGKKPLPDNPIKAMLVKAGYTAVPLASEADGHVRVDGKLAKFDWPMMLDTGATSSMVDEARMKQFGGTPEKQERGKGAAGNEITLPLYTLRGLSIGKYDTRRSWGLVQVLGFDMDWANKLRTQQKLTRIEGNFELLDGSAVIDLGSNTLYLRPVKASVQAKLAGAWVLKARTADGVRTALADDKETMTVTADRMAFKGGAKDTEHGYHVKDEWSLYRLALFDPKADELADTFRYRDAGYFKLDGDKLRLVRVVDESKLKVSPTEFAAPKGSGLQLLEYERAKPAKK